MHPDRSVATMVVPAPGPTIAPAQVRTQVQVPLQFPDGYTSAADVFTFTGLVDGREHLALGLGRWREAVTDAAPSGTGPLVRPHQRVPHGGRLRLPALRLWSTAARGRGADRRHGGIPALSAPGGSWHRAVREARRVRAAGRRPRHLPGQRRARASARTSVTTPWRHRCWQPWGRSGSACCPTIPTRPSSCPCSASTSQSRSPPVSTSRRRT